MMILATLCIVLLNSNLVWSFSTPRRRVFVGTPVTTRRLIDDCMTSNPRTLTTTTSVDEAISMLLDNGISGAPVLDQEGFLVGVISSSDFLHKEEGGVVFAMEGSAADVEGFIDVAKKITAQKVGDIMSPIPVTIGSAETMRSAATLMAKEKLHRILVVDDGNLVGIISSSDVMRDVLRVRRALLPEVGP